MSSQVQLITKKTANISGWYNDVIAAAKLAEHGPSKGSMIIRPYGYSIWQNIQAVLDRKIKDLGGENAYFPLFIPYSLLEKEKSHVQGFSPELAIVTHGGGEKLTEPLVVRPTSETIMYGAYSKWISSYRDLPLIINQWNNVVRWEKRPYLFLRTTEFLWQEGHSAHPTSDANQNFVEEALRVYVNVYTDYLAIYGYAGKKSESEKFAGGDQTLTYEMLMPDGKVIQGCTSHNLGRNFSKPFNIKFQDRAGKEQYVHQASWGFTTRSIGALILAHGDDHGLVLPPRIAPNQVVVIPIISKLAGSDSILAFAKKVGEILKSLDLSVKLDDSDQSPGWKFNQYELEGVPIRVEVGAREVERDQVSVKLRHDHSRHQVGVAELTKRIPELLAQIQSELLERSKKLTEENTRVARDYQEFKEIMKTTRGFIEAFWCEDQSCEVKIKDETKASTRCLPLGSTEAKGSCVYCGQAAKNRWLFGQSY